MPSRCNYHFSFMMIIFYHDGRHSYIALMRLALDRASDLIFFPLHTVPTGLRLSLDGVVLIGLHRWFLPTYYSADTSNPQIPGPVASTITVGGASLTNKYQPRTDRTYRSRFPLACSHRVGVGRLPRQVALVTYSALLHKACGRVAAVEEGLARRSQQRRSGACLETPLTCQSLFCTLVGAVPTYTQSLSLP